jgi:hypothetical protein
MEIQQGYLGCYILQLKRGVIMFLLNSPNFVMFSLHQNLLNIIFKPNNL